MIAEEFLNIRKDEKKRRGQLRDKAILETIQLVGSLTREQIQELYFGNLTTKCQERLRLLTQRKKILRGRCDVSNSYCYFINKKPNKIDHLIQLNWLYVYFKLNFKIIYWKNEYKTDIVIPDSLMIIENNQTIEPIFIEMQRQNNHSEFDKVKKYQEYFESELWAEKSWIKTNDNVKRFPQILVVVDGDSNYKNKLQDIINKENEKKLRFTVATLKEIENNIKEVIKI